MQVPKEISGKALKTLVKKVSNNAIRENRALGLNTTALVGRNIVSIAPNGTKKVIKQLQKQSKTTKKRLTIA